MSICIAIAVPDGIALAADSQTTWNQTIEQVEEKGTGKMIDLAKPISQPVSWSKMARKLFEFKVNGKSYAICIAGAALLNHKTVYSIFKSLEANYNGSGNYDDIVKFIVKGLKKELKEQLGVKDLKNSKQNITVHFIITGYEDNDVSKPIMESHIIFSGSLNINNQKNSSGHYLQSTNLNNPNRFGASWIGRTEFISHLIHPKRNLPPIRGQYELLSLEDANDYANFLVEFTCEYQRFAVMVPDCGKPIWSSKLTPKSYKEEVIKAS